MTRRAQSEAIGSPRWRDRLFGRLFTPQWARLERRGYRCGQLIHGAFAKHEKNRWATHSSRLAQVNGAGVNLKRFSASEEIRKNMRKELAIGDDDILFVTASRLSPEKNVAFALTLMSLMKGNVKYVVLGTGDLGALSRRDGLKTWH